MNFVLFHYGNDFPEHARECVRNINYFHPNDRIHFISNTPVTGPNITWYNIDKFECNEVMNSRFFLESYHAYLFRNSLFRFFFINELIKKEKLDNVVHFDNDVLVYTDYNKFIPIFSKENIFITPHSDEEYVCGTMYIRDNIDILCDYLYKLIKLDKASLDNIAGNGFMPNEMRLLALLNREKDCFKLLPILPFGRFSNFFGEFDSLFDPSSYGQHFGGTPDNPTEGWVAAQNKHRAIDFFIVDNTIKPIIFNNKMPHVSYYDKVIKLNNLHIHSKQTKKFAL